MPRGLRKSIADGLAAVARQRDPRALVQVVVVDGGTVPALGALVRRTFPDALGLPLPGGSTREQKNLGMAAATGEIVAFLDGATALRPPPGWRPSWTSALPRPPTWRACQASRC